MSTNQNKLEDTFTISDSTCTLSNNNKSILINKGIMNNYQTEHLLSSKTCLDTYIKEFVTTNKEEGYFVFGIARAVQDRNVELKEKEGSYVCLLSGARYVDGKW